MKKFLVSLFMATSISAFALTLCASAADVTGEYYENNDFFIISCAPDVTNIRKPITLKVYEDDADVYTSQRRSGDDGSARFTFKLPIDTAKTYVAKLNVNGEYKEVNVGAGEILKVSKKYIPADNSLLISGTYVFDSQSDDNEVKIVGKLAGQEKFAFSVLPDSELYSFEQAIPFSEMPYGDYTVEISAGNGAYVKSISFKYKDAQSIIALLKSSAPESIGEILRDDDNIAMLGMESYSVGGYTLKTLPDAVCAIVANQIADVNSVDTLKSCISKANFVYQINSANSAEEILKLITDGDRSVFDFESFAPSKIYKELSENEQTAILNGMKDADFKTFAEFNDALWQSIFLKDINDFEHWSQLKQFVEDYNKDYLKFTKTLTNSQYVYLYDKKPFSTFDEFVNQYGIAADSSSGSDSGSGSSGGGSGSKSSSNKGGGSVSVSGGYINNANSTSSFIDIDSVPWAKDAIEYLYKKNVVNGMGNNEFAPLNSVTREQYTKMIVLAFEIGDDSVNNEFSDVKSTDWCSKYISSAVRAGIINGIGDNMFGVGHDITREDVAVICYRALMSKGAAFNRASSNFADWNSVSDYAKEAVSYLAGAEIINGEDGNMFNPKEKCTRAQVAKIIYFALNHLNK